MNKLVIFFFFLIIGVVCVVIKSYDYFFYLGGLMFVIGFVFYLMLYLFCIKWRGLWDFIVGELDVLENKKFENNKLVVV